MEAYQLEKTAWDDRDFAVMSWHDATIWSMFANPAEHEFLLDLDYIFKWVDQAEHVLPLLSVKWVSEVLHRKGLDRLFREDGRRSTRASSIGDPRA